MKKYQLIMSLLVLLSAVNVLSASGCTKHATDGSLGDWGLNALKNNASWGISSTWVPNAGIQFIVKDNYNSAAGPGYPSGVHIRGTGSSYSFYDDPEVMYKGGYPVWEPYGGELYNLEAFYFDEDSNCMYVTVITSESPSAQGDAAPADFAMNLDNNPTTGKWGYEYGVKLENYHAPMTLFGLYSNPDWQQPPYIPGNKPSYFNNGTYIGQVTGVYTELKDDNGSGVYDNGKPNYIIQLAIPKDEVGNPTNIGFDSFHFSDYCGNDHIAGFGVTQVLDHFEFSGIHSPQTAGVPFSVTITAKDSANNTVLSYNGHATLSDLTGTISPTTTGNFVDGVWSGNITITKAYNATHINAQDTGKGGISNNFDVIAGSAATLDITPDAVTLNIGQSQQFTAECYDSYDNPTSCPPLNWSTNLGGSVNTSGFFTAPTSPAYGLVEAYNGTLYDSSNVTVIRRSAVSLEVVCVPSTIQLYENSTCTATAKDLYNNSWDATANSTFSTNDLQGNLTGNIYTAGTPGDWSVNATYDGVAGSTAVTVEAPEVSQLARIVISPPGPVQLAVGDNLTFSPSCYDTEDNSMPCPELSWSSSNSSVASVSSGVANVLTPGIAGITAENGTVVSNVAYILVSQEGEEFVLIVRCDPAVIIAGGTSTCTAQLNDSGVISDVTDSTTFSSSGGSMTENNFTATAAGNYAINGTFDSLTGSYEITVFHGEASSLTINCSPETLNSGATTTCTATAQDAYNNTWDVTSATEFSAQSGAGGSWSGNVYTSQNAGSWVVTGYYGEISGTTNITVTAQQPTPITPSYTPYSNGGGGGSVTRGCAYNDPQCNEGYDCVNNACVAPQPPAGNNTGGNSTLAQCSQTGQACAKTADCCAGQCVNYKCSTQETTCPASRVDILAPQTALLNDTIVLKMVDENNKSVVGGTILVTSPAKESMVLLTDSNGEATFKAVYEGLYTYSSPGCYLVAIRATNVIKLVTTLTPPAQPPAEQPVPPSLAMALSAYAPWAIGLLILLLILFFLATRKKKKKGEGVGVVEQ